MTERPIFSIQPAQPADVPVILAMIRELAEYEQLSHEVTATEEKLRAALFDDPHVAQAVIARTADGIPAGFALYFFNFSTFLAQPGLYLEDLFVRPPFRRHGLGRRLLVHLAQVAVARNCGRMEWSVLDWNEMALKVYRAIGAKPLDEWTIQRLTGPALMNLAADAPTVRPPSTE